MLLMMFEEGEQRSCCFFFDVVVVTITVICRHVSEREMLGGVKVCFFRFGEDKISRYMSTNERAKKVLK